MGEYINTRVVSRALFLSECVSTVQRSGGGIESQNLIRKKSRREPGGALGALPPLRVFEKQIV